MPELSCLQKISPARIAWQEAGLTMIAEHFVVVCWEPLHDKTTTRLSNHTIDPLQAQRHFTCTWRGWDEVQVLAWLT